MGAHNDTANDYTCFATGEQSILNPGTGNTIDLRGRDRGIATLSAGTYKLPNNTPTGVTFYAKATGNVTITTVSGTTVLSLTSGQLGILLCTSSTTWVGAAFTAGSGAASHADYTSIVNSQYSLSDYTADTNVGEVLADIYEHILNAAAGWQRGVPLSSLREVDTSGDVGNAAANGGLLASDTTPIFLADTAEALAVQWAASNSDIVAFTVDVPTNMDGAADVTVELLVQAAGTTNAPSFSVLTNFDGGTQITDTAAGSASASKQTITATIAAADVPTSAMVMSVQLVPGAHTTDAWTLYGIRVRGKQTLLS